MSPSPNLYVDRERASVLQEGAGRVGSTHGSRCPTALLSPSTPLPVTRSSRTASGAERLLLTHVIKGPERNALPPGPHSPCWGPSAHSRFRPLALGAGARQPRPAYPEMFSLQLTHLQTKHN